MRFNTGFTAIALCVTISAPVVAQQRDAQPSAAPLPSIALPPELERVLRDYERGWQNRDAKALAEIFTSDGFVLSNGRPAVRGREAIARQYADGGGPLALRALAYAVSDTVGYIIGAYAPTAGATDDGKFILALRRRAGGRWEIAADMDNMNRRPAMRPPPRDSAR